MIRRDLTGQRFGRLVVLNRVPSIRTGKLRTAWHCRCDCGAETIKITEVLTDGRTRSCGCLRAEATRRRSLRHGHAVGYRASRTHHAWQKAKERCYNPHSERYPRYGGRGIAMCDRWRNDFAAFLADMGECPPGLSLDRINVDGDYEPGNCRWATAGEQARNRSDNVVVVVAGERMILKDFARRINANYKLVHRLYRRGTSLDVISSRLGRAA